MPTITGSITPVRSPCYEIRLGTAHVAHGSPYERGFLVVAITHSTCELRLVDRPIAPAEMREIIRLLRAEGFDRIKIDRRGRGGGARVVDLRARAKREHG